MSDLTFKDWPLSHGQALKKIFTKLVEDIDFDPNTISDEYYEKIVEDPRIKEIAEGCDPRILAAAAILLSEVL